MQLQNQFSGWQLMNQYCEPALNEIYTDIWHEYKDGDVNSEVVARPVVVVRDKPFMLKEIVRNTLTYPFLYNSVKDLVETNWTFYDDVPRIRIDGSSIAQINIASTLTSSPNYLMVNFQSNVFDKAMSSALSMVKSIIRLDAEQDRFGGQEYTPTVQFTGFDADAAEDSTNKAGTSQERWFSSTAEVSRIWYSYLYRYGSGSIDVIDDNYPLSIGFNAQFKVGYVDLVGHIDSLTTNFVVEEDGLEHTVTTVGLSRIVYSPLSDQKDGINNLQLLPPGVWGKLFDPEVGKALNRFVTSKESEVLPATVSGRDSDPFGGSA